LAVRARLSLNLVSCYLREDTRNLHAMTAMWRTCFR